MAINSAFGSLSGSGSPLLLPATASALSLCSTTGAGGPSTLGGTLHGGSTMSGLAGHGACSGLSIGCSGLAKVGSDGPNCQSDSQLLDAHSRQLDTAVDASSTSPSSFCATLAELASQRDTSRHNELSSHLSAGLLPVLPPAVADLFPLEMSAEIKRQYRPHPGDLVDGALADFVNRPAHAASRTLFCRLHEGTYLYGAQCTNLQLNQASGQLEALLDGNGVSEWVALEAFIAAMQRSQSVHLQRARELVAVHKDSHPL